MKKRLYSGVVSIRRGEIGTHNHFFTVLATSKQTALGHMLEAAREETPHGDITNTFVWEITPDVIRDAYAELD